MNPPVNPMPEGVTPRVAYSPQTNVVVYPNTSGSVELDSSVQTIPFVLDGATEENYSQFDIPGVATSAAVWDSDFHAFVYNLPFVPGVNTWQLTYNGVEVWNVSVNVTIA